MKIIHFADLHIGSKIERLPSDLRLNLISKLRNTFMNIIQYANENDIDTIIMSGDIFDRDSVLLVDKKYFYDSIKANPHIDFYYIRGNHDLNSKYIDNIDNLHTFYGVQSYIKDDVRIIGYELENDDSKLYNHVPFSNDKYNIMMLHGDIYNSRDTNYIDLKKLQDKNINYFALGHIHKRDQGLIGKSLYSYPGCTFGRGFDEIGEKGFLVLDTNDNSVTFHEISDFIFEYIEIQVNGMNEAELKNKIINELKKENKKLITEIKLTGKSEFEIDIDDLNRTFQDYRYYVTFKNKSKLALNYIHNEKENSLRNMFINKVLSDKTMDDETKEKVISYGLSKLMKEEG